MTLEELRKIVDTATAETWHQHANGGGWIENTAHVDPSAFINSNAQVSGNAQVYGDARVSGNAQVSGNARVYGNAWEKSPPYIKGTRHSITMCKIGHLQIGCHLGTIADWVAKYEKIGKSEGYSPLQIAEYGIYINAMAAIADLMANRITKPVAPVAKPKAKAKTKARAKRKTVKS